MQGFLHAITPKDAVESAEGIFVNSGVLKEIEKRTQAVLMSKDASKQTFKRLAVKPRAIFMVRYSKRNEIDKKEKIRV